MKYRKPFFFVFTLFTLMFSVSTQALWNPFSKESEGEVKAVTSDTEKIMNDEETVEIPKETLTQVPDKTPSKVRLTNSFFDDDFWVWDDPSEVMRQFEQRYDQMMRPFFENELFSTPQVMVVPTQNYGTSLDVSEKDDSFVVKADVAGFEPEDISIRIEEEQRLVLRGERKREKEESDEGQKYYLRERNFGKFSREFYLPTKVDEAHVKATFEDGVLTIVLPKKEKMSDSSHEIKIEVQ